MSELSYKACVVPGRLCSWTIGLSPAEADPEVTMSPADGHRLCMGDLGSGSPVLPPAIKRFYVYVVVIFKRTICRDSNYINGMG